MDTYKKLLKEFISFKSISADPTCKKDLEQTATWLTKIFKKNGFKAQAYKGFGNPIVVASYVAAKSYKTYLIYGHYDVQPAKKSEGWKNYSLYF